MPNSLVDNLIMANPDYHFSVIYRLDGSSELYYSSVPTLASTEPAILGNLGNVELKSTLESLIPGMHHVYVMITNQRRSRLAWARMLNCSRLDLIDQFVPLQFRILNMYQHQVDCAGHVQTLESLHRRRFDYIVSTREDVFLFGPLNLTAVLETSSRCDIFAKGGMLSFHGLNMRLQLMRRARGLDFLGLRLAYYRHACEGSLGGVSSAATVAAAAPSAAMSRVGRHPRRETNTEMFEADQARWLRMRRCDMHVTSFPVTSVRHVLNGSVCFREEGTYCVRDRRKPLRKPGEPRNTPVPLEADQGLRRRYLIESRCVPPASVEFVLDHLCSLPPARSHTVRTRTPS